MHRWAVPRKGGLLGRCGRSAKKPYCDGTHGKVSFDGTETAERGDTRGRRAAYKGAELTIYDDRSICSHAGVCTSKLPSVWKMGKEPWIDPNGEEMASITAIIEQCPSGALSYSLEAGGDSDEKPHSAGITVLPNGPYALQGEVTLISADSEPRESGARVTLCRCGASRNKPYCDGSHWKAGFKDP